MKILGTQSVGSSWYTRSFLNHNGQCKAIQWIDFWPSLDYHCFCIMILSFFICHCFSVFPPHLFSSFVWWLPQWRGHFSFPSIWCWKGQLGEGTMLATLLTPGKVSWPCLICWQEGEGCSFLLLVVRRWFICLCALNSCAIQAGVFILKTPWPSLGSGL